MKRLFIFLVLVGSLFLSCRPKGQRCRVIEKSLPIEVFVAEFIRNNPNYTLNDITKADREIELMNLMADCFMDETPTETEINDWLWFDRDFIYEHCGLDENGEIPLDEDGILESLENLNSTECFEDFCTECDTCCLNKMCNTLTDCAEMFENVKNQIIPFDVLTNEVKESYGY